MGWPFATVRGPSTSCQRRPGGVITDVMYADAPYTVIARAVHAHPTVSELLPTTLQQLQALG